MRTVRRPQPTQPLSRRDFAKLLGGVMVGAPIAGWLLVPSAGAARPGAYSRPRKFPTPTPTPQPTGTPAPTATPQPTATGTPSATSGTAISVTSFGATGNGTTDDTAAIQAAINAGQQTPNAVVAFPAGTYRITNSLEITAPVQLAGPSGGGATIAAASGIHMLELWNANHVTLSFLTLRGTFPAASFGYAVRTNGASYLNIHDCQFVDIPDTAISLSKVDHVWVTNCQFQTTGTSGIRLQDPGTGNANTNVWIQNNTMSNVNATTASGHAGVQAQGGNTAQGYITITNNAIQSRGVGLGMDSTDYGTFSNNTITGIGPDGEGIAFTGSNNTISGNSISNCPAAGILQWGVAYRANSTNVVSGNTCWNNAQGIAVVCGQSGTVIDNLTIQNNRCFNSSTTHPQGYGVQSYIDGTTNFTWRNVQIINNDLRGNAEGPINLIPPSQAYIAANLG